MAGRICRSLEAMCISHEASPRHGILCSQVLGPPTYSRPQGPICPFRQWEADKSMFRGDDRQSVFVVVHAYAFKVAFWPPYYLHTTGEHLNTSWRYLASRPRCLLW